MPKTADIFKEALECSIEFADWWRNQICKSIALDCSTYGKQCSIVKHIMLWLISDSDVAPKVLSNAIPAKVLSDAKKRHDSSFSQFTTLSYLACDTQMLAYWLFTEHSDKLIKSFADAITEDMSIIVNEEEARDENFITWLLLDCFNKSKMTMSLSIEATETIAAELAKRLVKMQEDLKLLKLAKNAIEV